MSPCMERFVSSGSQLSQRASDRRFRDFGSILIIISTFLFSEIFQSS